jgi:hypothetical protein
MMVISIPSPWNVYLENNSNFAAIEIIKAASR